LYILQIELLDIKSSKIDGHQLIYLQFAKLEQKKHLKDVMYWFLN
jgi:hypothetical protein